MQWLICVRRQGFPGRDTAKRTIARAYIAQYHERCGARCKARPYIGTHGALAHRMQMVTVKQTFHLVQYPFIYTFNAYPLGLFGYNHNTSSGNRNQNLPPVMQNVSVYPSICLTGWLKT
jgi:hypothetical protein